MLFGMALGVGGIIQFIETWFRDPSLLTAAECSLFALLGTVAITSVGASVGLLSGHRCGWWMAIALCYLGFATFLLVPAIHLGVSERVLRIVIAAAIFVLYWSYLHRKNVLAYFGPRTSQGWHLHVGLFALSVIVALGLGIWVRSWG